MSQLVGPVINQATGVTQMSAVFIFLCTLVAQFIFGLNLFLSFIRKKRVLFYEKASHTYTISTIKDRKA
ncbi:hypothetical protein SNF32_00985 [Enterococcus mundtii]|nr:hypothetical protein [Enterococcus mundtii]